MNYALASDNKTAPGISHPEQALMTGGPNSDGWWWPHETSSEEGLPNTRQPKPASIVDGFIDLLDLLPVPKKLGMIADLSVRYYDGWHPSREEIADLVAVELGLLSFDECTQRKSLRRTQNTVTDITALIKDRHRSHPPSQSGPPADPHHA